MRNRQHVCTLCGGAREWASVEGTLHYSSPRHVEAVAEWDAAHPPRRARSEPTHHDGHRLLGIACHCEAKAA